MLVLAAAYGQSPVPLTHVAEHERISLGYLEQLVAGLRRRGLIESVRGARGGYLLAMPPQNITLGDVLRAAEESLGPVDCLADGPKTTCCERESRCNVRPAWEKLRDTMVGLLDSTTLADLIGGQEPTGDNGNSNEERLNGKV